MSNVRKSSNSVSKKKSTGKKSIKNQNSKMSNMEGSVAGDIESKIDAESKVDLESKIDTQSKVDAADQKAGEEAKQDNPDNAPDQPKPEPG